MKISLIQLGIRWESPEANCQAAAALVREAAAAGADMACLPELFSSGVTLRPREFAQTVRGPTCRFLKGLAREGGLIVVGSFIEENGEKPPLNTSVAYGPTGRMLAKYHKAHLFTHGGEDMSYSLGEPAVATFKAGGFTVCPVICYDLRFPETFIAGVEKGADLFIVQANWPNPRKRHWDALLQARAIECQAYVAGVNQAGESPRNTFFGASRIINPGGETMAEAEDLQAIVSAEISPDEVRHNREKYPFLRERRKIRIR